MKKFANSFIKLIQSWGYMETIKKNLTLILIIANIALLYILIAYALLLYNVIQVGGKHVG